MTGMAESLGKEGKEVLVLADGRKNLDQDSKIPYSIKRFYGWKPIRRIKKAMFLEKICKEKNVEAIYADSWKSIEYVKKKNKKILVLAHGTEIPKQYWSIMLDLLRFKRNRILKSYKNVYKIIANSTYTKDLMQVSLNINPKSIEVIHPGIDIYKEFISEEERKYVNSIVKNRRPIISTLARVEKRKGHEYVIHAVHELINKFPNIIYLIAGKGPYLDKIKNLVKTLSLENNVIFLGWITEPEKSLILKKSDIFIMTPILVGESVEGFGMAFIDAAFHGIATIGSNSGGISDAIIDGHTGLLCQSGDQASITFSLKKLIEDEALRHQLGENGYKIAIEKYAWNKKIFEYLDAAK